MNWNDFARDVHQTAVGNGLWYNLWTFDDIICECLVHLGRAYEEHRSGRPNYYNLCQPSGEKEHPCEWDLQKPCPLSTGELACEHRDRQPHGAAAELGGCVLRLLDYLATVGVDIDSELGTIPAPENLTALVCECVESLAGKNTMGVSRSAGDSEIGRITRAIICIMLILDWARQNNMDLESICHELHECNKARAGRRGGAEP